MLSPSTLPIRIAQPRYAALDRLTDEWFEMLCRCGITGISLQMSPFDAFSGNR
jgi:hypothetical protein